MLYLFSREGPASAPVQGIRKESVVPYKETSSIFQQRSGQARLRPAGYDAVPPDKRKAGFGTHTEIFAETRCSPHPRET